VEEACAKFGNGNETHAGWWAIAMRVMENRVEQVFRVGASSRTGAIFQRNFPQVNYFDFFRVTYRV
jgi:hypothetical protein